MEHPKLSGIDVVALPLEHIQDAELYPINEMGEVPMKVSIGIDAFILGFPFGVNVSAFPILKRASIASEPLVWVADQPRFYVDTASRPGMSGSPVIIRSWGSYTSEEGGLNIGPAVSTRFIGIYSGRLGAEDELHAQLGIVWRAELVRQIIEGGQRAAPHSVGG